MDQLLLGDDQPLRRLAPACVGEPEIHPAPSRLATDGEVDASGTPISVVGGCLRKDQRAA